MRIFLGVFAIALSVLFLAVWISSDRSPIGHWASASGQGEYAEAYALAMKTMPEPTSSYDLKTSFGSVRAYKWAADSSESAIPILLLPGRGSGTPMWGKNLEDLARTREVYALDAMGDAGMSVQAAPLRNSADQALWLEEALVALGLSKVHVLGHSFGGWLAANYASRYPSRIATLALIEPVFVFQSIKPSLILKSIPYNLKFLPKAWRQGLMSEISGAKAIDRSDPVARMIDDGTSLYATKLPAPTQITPEQMRAWAFPVYLALAGKSPIHDSAKGLALAEGNVQALAGKVWPEATHSLPMEYPGMIDGEICAFIDKSLE